MSLRHHRYGFKCTNNGVNQKVHDTSFPYMLPHHYHYSPFSSFPLPSPLFPLFLSIIAHYTHSLFPSHHHHHNLPYCPFSTYKLPRSVKNPAYCLQGIDDWRYPPSLSPFFLSHYYTFYQVSSLPVPRSLSHIPHSFLLHFLSCHIDLQYSELSLFLSFH